MYKPTNIWGDPSSTLQWIHMMEIHGISPGKWSANGGFRVSRLIYCTVSNSKWGVYNVKNTWFWTFCSLISVVFVIGFSPKVMPIFAAGHDSWSHWNLGHPIFGNIMQHCGNLYTSGMNWVVLCKFVLFCVLLRYSPLHSHCHVSSPLGYGLLFCCKMKECTSTTSTQLKLDPFCTDPTKITHE